MFFGFKKSRAVVAACGLVKPRGSLSDQRPTVANVGRVWRSVRQAE